VRTRLIAALAVAALLLSGCVQEVKPKKLETLQDFKEQRIKWRTCYDTLKCADVLVPVDYTNIKLGTFRISMLKHEATNKEDRIGSLFVNPGGPGASGVEYAYPSMTSSALIPAVLGAVRQFAVSLMMKRTRIMHRMQSQITHKSSKQWLKKHKSTLKSVRKIQST